MAKFNADNHAPSVAQLAKQDTANPNPAAPSTSPSGPTPGRLESGVGFSGVQKQMYDRISSNPTAIESLKKKKS